MATRVREYTDYGADRGRRTMIRWGAIFGGAVLGMGIFALLTALWFALGFGSEVTAIRDNIEWFVGISSVVSLFAAGYLAGYLSGERGAGPGFLHGMTIWGLLLILTLGVGVPALLNVFNVGQFVGQVEGAGGIAIQRAFGVGDAPLWATFWSMLGSFLAAGLGGALGGATTRTDDRTMTRREEVDTPDTGYVDVTRDGEEEDARYRATR